MAMIVDAFAGKLVEKLGNVIEEKAIMVLGAKDELQKLQRRMKRIACVLKDAERRRIQQDEAVKLWVEELKDVMYDAEDIIDLCMIQGTGLLLQDDHHHTQLAESSATASTRLAKSSAAASTRVHCFNFPLRTSVLSVPFRFQIVDKIKSLNAKLEEISEDKDKFNFITSYNSSDAYVVSKPSSRQSSSLPEPNIVGWDIIDATNSLSMSDRFSEIYEDKDKIHFITSYISSDVTYVMNEASSRQSSFLSESDIVCWDIRDATKSQSRKDRLTEIYEDKDKFHFITSYKSSDDVYVMNEASYRQSSSLPESDIVGWDIIDATNSLVELLVSQHQQKCRLFAIVGMGGIGKTTLAQLIYNDSKINDDFVLHSWICVSKFYTSRTALLKELIRNVGGTCGEATTTAELLKILCDILNGKSLFLVLDDVWDADVWIDLIKNSVERTTTKCRVLVTTRDRNTATKMGATLIHNVNKLPLNFGWELLCKKVFTNNDKSEIQRMKDIGMQIVEKCDGLPVAIKAIAGVLITTEQNKREWQNILDSDAWTITGLPEDEASSRRLKPCQH